MAFVIAQACIGVKDTACVDACPTDAIHAAEGSPQYYIDPVTCIDCAACEPVCPVKAIYPGDQVPADQAKFIAVNSDFFKGFDKAKSTAYTRKKQEAEGAKAGEPGHDSKASTGEAASADWVEVENWQKDWEAHKDFADEPLERQKRYGRVRAIFETGDQYVIRFFLPEKTPHHRFVYQYGLPREMRGYEVSAEIQGGVVRIGGIMKDRRLSKLCGLVNSFPDRFHVEHRFERPVSAVSVKPQGAHVVDVVVTKAAPQAKAA
jgi:NAD-dependent dihydropyrimidine dehydrogenase PreA subunit